MTRYSLICFILWTLLQLLVEVNCQVTSFKPNVLSGHTATLIDNKLYIIGGVGIDSAGEEFFYLDVSVPFNTQELSWHDSSNINIVPSHNSASSVIGGANKDILFLYVGEADVGSGPFVYTFDSKSNSWSNLKIAGVNTVKKFALTGVMNNNNGKMYLWGGYAGNHFLNDMLILDTINLSWGKGSSINAPTPRIQYGAVLLPDNNIMYIGGIDVNVPVNANLSLHFSKDNALTLNEVYIYNTINDNWSVKTTSGNVPSNRAAFSTVLGLDGKRVIIFGGFIGFGDSDPDRLYVLDLTNYNWYIPKISGKTPKPRAWHKANVIGNYMVVSFGQGYDKSAESDVLLLDISNDDEYIWTTSFDPPSSRPSDNNATNTANTTTQATIACTAMEPFNGGLLLLLAFGCFLLYKWGKNKQKRMMSAIPIAEKENYDNHVMISIKDDDQPINNNYNYAPIINTDKK